MLAERIISTLRFFDLQGIPLTAFEVNKYLIADVRSLQSKLDDQYELTALDQFPLPVIHYDTILTQLQILTREKKVRQQNGYYALYSREELIEDRLRTHLKGLKRERLIQRYGVFLKYIPFVRGVALLGSQALGQKKVDSDIDLFVITDERYIGLARTFLTVFFQALGVRRHGNKIANRFCLNHYMAGPLQLKSDRNLFTAYEYIKHRPLAYPASFKQFLKNNDWVYTFFPNAKSVFESESAIESVIVEQSKLQSLLEKLLDNRFGQKLEKKLLAMQLNRIKPGNFTISNQWEMSFHPNNRKQKLFETFFNEAHELTNLRMD